VLVIKDLHNQDGNEDKFNCDYECTTCGHRCGMHEEKGCEILNCQCKLSYFEDHTWKPAPLEKKLTSVQPTALTQDGNVSAHNPSDNHTTHQDLEPNIVKIFTKGDLVEFSVECKRFDLQQCIEESVEGYNKLAKALGKKIIHLNQVIGAPVVEEHTDFRKKYNIDDKFEERYNLLKPKAAGPKLFHNRLRLYRSEKGIGLLEFCEKLNINPNDYVKEELGSSEKTMMTDELLLEISNILHLSDTQYQRLVSSRNK
jgi:hypothetical protein